jgi:hypothetical protein
MAGGAGSAIGRGGMLTKILAAKRAARSGAATIIASGREPDVLLRIVAGEAIGTELVAATPKVVARKLWMSDHLQLRGSVTVDEGAAAQVRGRGRSLLPIGVVAVAGDFHRGDVIAVRLASGEEIGRGLSNYSSAEARLIARRPSADIERLLGLRRRAGADPPRQLRVVVRRGGPARRSSRCPGRESLRPAGAAAGALTAGSTAGGGRCSSPYGAASGRRNRSGASSRWCGRMPERR